MTIGTLVMKMPFLTLVSVWQNISSHLQRQYIVYHSSHMLRISRIGTRPVDVHYVHRWSRAEGWWAWREVPCLRRWHAVVSVVSLRRHINCCWYTQNVNQWMSATRLKLNLDHTELLWSGSRHSLRKLGGCGPTVKLSIDAVKASAVMYDSSELSCHLIWAWV